MKKYITKYKALYYCLQISVLFAILFNVNDINAKNGDTLSIRTIEFLAPRTGWFEFPSDPTKFEKIYLNYKLRCPPGKPCGEWDYLAHVFIRTYYAPSFRVDSTVKNQFAYSENQTFTYTYTFDNQNNVLSLDSTANKVRFLEFYNDNQNPTTRTDVKNVYEASYRYFFNGNSVDSILVGADNTLNLIKTKVDYNDKVTFYESVELYRYITPYGNGLNLGAGFTWTENVTDFAPLLSGKVFLDAPNSQEDLELTFDFIEGTPVRDIKRFIPLWQKWVTYNGNFEKHIDPIEIELQEGESNVRFKHIQTGHGFGGNSDNCAEFCRKEGYVKVNGEQKYNIFVWRECGDNPVYPQGGTWLTDRTNWCPGAEVSPYDFEISEFIKGQNKFTIDWDMEFYNTPYNNGSNQDPRWLINSYVVTYGDIKFENNAEMVDIVRPTTKQLFQRLNPACGQPVIVIRNSGKANLKSLVIEYGDKDGIKNTFNWVGDLKFNDTAWVALPAYQVSRNSVNEFVVELKSPNGADDEYNINNIGYSKYTPTPEYYNNITFELQTNNYDILGASSPYRYWLTNSKGERIYELMQTENRQKYTKDLVLPDDCYELTIENTFGYGLYFWVLARNNDGSSNGFFPGSFKLLNNNVTSALNFNPDFGNRYTHQFTVASQPTISANVDVLKMGTVKVGEEFTKSFFVKPANYRGLKVTKVELLLASFKGFNGVTTIPEIPANGLDLAEGDSLEIIVTFKPKSTGDKSTNVVIYSNDRFSPSKSIQVSAFGGDFTSVEENFTDNSSFEIVNQNNDEVVINYTLGYPISNSKISVFDMLGNEIIFQNINNQNNSTNINLKNLTNGVYFILIDEMKNLGVRKFIVNR